MKLGAGIVEDLKARAPWYVSDWTEGFRSGYRCGFKVCYQLGLSVATLSTGTTFASVHQNDSDNTKDATASTYSLLIR